MSSQIVDSVGNGFFRVKSFIFPVNLTVNLCAGPFMVVLFAKLENMLQNSLYVNILLTGIIAQLACYPQPLLRSFLLNTNMVFQPSVKSLIQVHWSLQSLKCVGLRSSVPSLELWLSECLNYERVVLHWWFHACFDCLTTSGAGSKRCVSSTPILCFGLTVYNKGTSVPL